MILSTVITWPGHQPVAIRQLSQESDVSLDGVEGAAHLPPISVVEADVKQNKISITSPIARALIGKSKGDSVEVSTPGGGGLLITASKDLDVELFYDRDTSLPIGICLTEANGDKKTVLLRNLKRNELDS